MEEHIRGIITYMHSRWEFKPLVKKISTLLNIDESIVKDLIHIAAVLHDFGKIKKEFQERCRVEGCKHFPKHYITSARFALNIAYEVGILAPEDIEKRFNDLLCIGKNGNYDIGDAYALCVVIPTLLHNYAHLREESLLNISELETFIVIDEYCRDSYLRILEWIENFLKSDIAGKLLDAIVRNLNKPRIELSILPLRRSFLLSFRPTFEKVVAEVVTGLLNLCDGRVAYISRRCRQ